MLAAPAALPSGRLSDVDTGQTSNLAACGRWSRYTRLINWGPHTQRARRYEYLRRIHNTRALLSCSTSGRTAVRCGTLRRVVASFSPRNVPSAVYKTQDGALCRRALPRGAARHRNTSRVYARSTSQKVRLHFAAVCTACCTTGCTTGWTERFEYSYNK